MPYEKTVYLYLIKEPAGHLPKILIWIILIQAGIIVWLLYGHSLAILIGMLAGIPMWLIIERSVGLFKVGITNNPKQRLTAINNGNARSVYYCKLKAREDARVVEKEIHRLFKKRRKDGEWFRFWFWEIWLLHWRYY